MAWHTYSGTAQHAALTAAANVLVLTPAENYKVQVLSASLTNENNETNEQLQAALYEASAAGTGSATAVTIVPQAIGDATSSTTTLEHTYATTEPTLASNPLIFEGFASVAGWNYTPSFDEAIIVPYGKILVLRVNTTSFTSIDLRARITWRESALSDPL